MQPLFLRGFPSCETWTENPRVGGSIPPPAIFLMRASRLWCEPFLTNEIRLERGGRGMVRAVGQLRCAMDRHNSSPHSRFPANRRDFGNCARIRAMDALSQRLLPGPANCRSLE